MTAREILGILGRWWYLALAVLLIAAGGTFLMLRDGGTYSTRAVVEFRWPGTASIESYNGATNVSVIALADMVAYKVNDGHDPDRYSWDKAPLYGVGIREGEVVDVAFSGNQWQTDDYVAEISVQVVGRSEQEVRTRREAAVADVLQTAHDLQLKAGASYTSLIAGEQRPLSAQIEHVAPNRQTIVAAALAMAAAGMIVATGVSVMADRWAHGRRRVGRETAR